MRENFNVNQVPDTKNEEKKQMEYSDGLITKGGREDIDLPDDKQELFRNFDKYVPKDFKPTIYMTEPPTLLTRDGIKRLLEKKLYGATMDDVRKYSEKISDESVEDRDRNAENYDIEIRWLKKHCDDPREYEYKKDELEKRADYYDLREQQATEFFNALTQGSLERALGRLESWCFWGSGKTNEEKEEMKPLIKRLYAETNNHDKTAELSKDDLLEVVNISKNYNNMVCKDDEDFDEEQGKLDSVVKEIQKGNDEALLSEIEDMIGHIQMLRFGSANWRLEKASREYPEHRREILEKGYGESITLTLKKLRTAREYILNKHYNHLTI